MRPEERLIVAIDTDILERAISFVQLLAAAGVEWFKVGSQLLYAGHAHSVATFVHSLGKKIFWDNKLSDTPNTVGASIANLMKTAQPEIFSISGRELTFSLLETANQNKNGGRVFVVTHLTSDNTATNERESGSVENFVLEHTGAYIIALMTHTAHGDGIICPSSFAKHIKNKFGELQIISAGIRPEWFGEKSNHAQTFTPAEALNLGADYLVVGRPIWNAPKNIGGPRGAAEKILEEIAKTSK